MIKSLLVAVLALLVNACMMMPPMPAADPVFKNMRTQYESQIKGSLSSIEGAESELNGAMKGVTPEVEADPQYKSFIGKRDAVQARFQKVQTKAKDLLAWAEKTEPAATEEDRNKLSSDASAVNLELRDVDSSVRALIPEVQRIQGMVSAQLQTEKNLKAVRASVQK